MDGYFGSDDILEKLEFACYNSVKNLYWGEVMELFSESLVEIKRLRDLTYDCKIV